ncbi:MAG: hypothetical protein HRU01_09075 [Myxococcales bacterium]|nr:hypothetical protein [Myxococcales bacterium]
MRAKAGGLSALFIATLGAIALWIAAGAQRVEAGAFTFAGETYGVDLITHPEGYTGSGGVVNVTVCVDPTSANADEMEVPVQNLVNTWNALNPVTGNVLLGGANDLTSNELDFESMALHEVGHCIGLAHSNAASESGLTGNDRDATKATDGANNSFDIDEGDDGVMGSGDDERDDDVNLHWFRTSNNNPFTIDSVVDSTTYSRDLDDLPEDDLFATNGDRNVAALLGSPNTEAVMQQGTFFNEEQRQLSHDDVATLRYGMSGIDEVEGTSDDYTMLLTYSGLTTSCDIVLDFDNSETGFAVCQIGGVFLNSDHVQTTSSAIFFNNNFNWFFTPELSICGDDNLDPGEQCDDGNLLDGDCCSSACAYEAPNSSCDLDDDVCTDDRCDSVGVCVDGDDLDCDNGMFCDGSESCDETLGCQAGTPVVIDDGVGCTDDSCDEGSDVVVNAPNAASCDNGMFCDGSESCDATLDCQAGTPVVIDDGVGCTDDSCDEGADVVVNSPNAASCDNGMFCDGAETCDATLDCQAGTSVVVDDGVGCTDDSCDEGSDVVVNAPNAASCDNGMFCDGSETCDATLDCQAGTSVVVDDGVGCTDDSCDEVGDVVVNAPNTATCDDSDPCTAGSCDANLGCLYEPIPNCPAPVPAANRSIIGLLIAMLLVLGVRSLATRT